MNPQNHNYQLVVMDMDSTLISQEAIDLLGDSAGCGEKMQEITAIAMEGGMQFEKALRMRVKMLAGFEMDKLEQIQRQLTLTPGAATFLKTIKSLGYKTGLVSGGFDIFVDPLAKELGIEYTLSNQLEIKDGKLTGELLLPIIDRSAKAQFLIDIAHQNNIALEKTVAIGDGANDAEMLSVAGLGIAFCAHPNLQTIADISINIADLEPIISILGH